MNINPLLARVSLVLCLLSPALVAADHPTYGWKSSVSSIRQSHRTVSLERLAIDISHLADYNYERAKDESDYARRYYDKDDVKRAIERLDSFHDTAREFRKEADDSHGRVSRDLRELHEDLVRRLHLADIRMHVFSRSLRDDFEELQLLVRALDRYFFDSGPRRGHVVERRVVTPRPRHIVRETVVYCPATCDLRHTHRYSVDTLRRFPELRFRNQVDNRRDWDRRDGREGSDHRGRDDRDRRDSRDRDRK